MPARKREDPEWMSKQDANSLKPVDPVQLQIDLTKFKKKCHQLEEDNRTLKAERDKHEKRVKYTVEKFNEIKAKEQTLIMMGEQICENKLKTNFKLAEAKYKKKIEALTMEIKVL